MALNRIESLLVLVALALSVGCASMKDPHPVMRENDVATLQKMVGKVVEFEGIPIGKKASQALLTKYGRIEIDSCWPDDVFSEIFGSKRRIVVRGLLAYEPESIWHRLNPNQPEQTIYREGEIIPAYFELRDNEIVKKE